jgi:primosomal protein N''
MKQKVRQFVHEPDDFVSSEKINHDVDKLLFTRRERFCSYIKSIQNALKSLRKLPEYKHGRIS